MNKMNIGRKGMVLFVASLQVLTMLTIIATVPVAPVQGAGVPATINGDWLINTNLSYMGGTVDINAGNIDVQADSSLTLYKVTVRFNPTFAGNNGIIVRQGGKLYIDSCTILSGNGNQWQALFDFGAIVEVTDSDISGFGDGSGFGIMQVGSSGVKFDGNDIHDGERAFIIDGGTNGIAAKLTNNTFRDMTGEALFLTNTASTVTGNTFKNTNSGNQRFGAVIIYNGAQGSGVQPVFERNTLKDNTGAGLVVADIPLMVIRDCVLDQARDFQVEGDERTTAVEVYDTTFETVAMNQLGVQNANKVTFKPFYKTDISVKLDSTSMPIAGATVDIKKLDGTSLVANLLTGPNGKITGVFVPQYKMEHPGGQGGNADTEDYTPQVFWARADVDGKSIQSNTSFAVDRAGNQVNITLDDLAPVLIVTEPKNGMRTNETGIDVIGTTEPLAYVTVKGMPATVQPDGSFSKFLGLMEGKNAIPVQATDAAGNMVTVNLEIIRDTMAPTVKIATPGNGTTLSTPDPYVTGTAEFGTFLTINGKIVTVQQGGTFNTTVHLVEGENTLTALDTDLVGNIGTYQIKVFLDSTAPSLTVVEPSDGKKTKEMNLTISGITEKDAFMTINGFVVNVNGIKFDHKLVMVEGENRIVLRVSDSVGNTNTKVLTVYLDTTPPTVTITSPKDYMSTNSDTVLVTGTTEPGATVKVNGQTAENIAGTFSKEIKLGTSQNKILVEVSDAVGNTVSKDLHVIKDTIPPELQVLSPTENKVFNGETLGKCEVRGKTEAGATIYINGEKVGLAGTTFQGYVYLADGNNSIQVTAYDEAGNIETVDLFVTYDSRVKYEILTPVDNTNTSANVIRATGFVEPGTTLKLNSNIVVVTSDGGFSYDLPLVEGKNTLTFYMTDKAGNTAIVTKIVNVSGSGKNPSSSSAMLNILFLVLVIVFIVAIIVVLMMGRSKAPKAQYASDEPPPPDFSSGIAPPPNFGTGGTPPPPDFSSGGEAPPPGYGYEAAPQEYAQEQYPTEGYDQSQDIDATAEDPAVTEEQVTAEGPEEPEAVPVKQPDMIDDEEDMTPKKAPIPEDAPKPTMSFKDMKSDEEVASEDLAVQKRKSDTWSKKDKPVDALDEILNMELKK